MAGVVLPWGASHAQGHAPGPAQGRASPPPDASAAGKTLSSKVLGGTGIVAVVNGDVISRDDVENRRRLFALSTGLPITNEVLDRLTQQVTRQLIDERLRLQESQRKRIVVQDADIVAAIGEIESRNGMPAGGLRRQLASNGVEMRTLIDQFRVQLAWGRVLRQAVQLQGPPTDADIADQAAQFQAQIGQPEYRVSEIFIPVANPAQDGEAKRFVDTIIQQLRAGAPFPVVAAQFSQTQTALQGGDLGWVQGNQLDPAVLRVIAAMPPGAVSNPIPVAGGYSIVSLRAKRELGKELANMLTLRQIFLPFTQQLDPQHPTPQQIAQLEQAKKLSASLHSCEAVEEAAKAAGSTRPVDPGAVSQETLNPPILRSVVAGLAVGQMSQPLPSEQGILLLMVCSREQKNIGVPSHDELADKIISERVELTSRQLMRDLQRRAIIDQRT